MKQEKTYFDPNLLSRVNGLILRARQVVDGLRLGIHKSRSKGFSTDFEEYREYSPGDDLRHLDWKAYGKFDRYFIKQYRRTTNLKAQILLDVSGSMDYGSQGLSKFDYGCLLAASLSYLMLKQQDAPGLVTFSDKVDRVIPSKARQGHLATIIEALEASRPQGKSAVGPVLQRLASSFTRRGLAVIISDLLDDPEEILKGIKQLRYRGGDVIVFHLLDKDELDFPFQEVTRFQDLEEDLKVLADPRAIRKAYLEAIASLIDTYRTGCGINTVDYVLLNTSAPLDRALVSYLSWRDKGIFNP
ncbi:MAG: DUF58 domain-containing protein [Thermodesulfobacteriota bacterium]